MKKHLTIKRKSWRTDHLDVEVYGEHIRIASPRAKTDWIFIYNRKYHTPVIAKRKTMAEVKNKNLIHRFL